MKINLETKKKIASQWFAFLQSQICEEFERIERVKFRKKTWKKSKNQKDGGGTYVQKHPPRNKDINDTNTPSISFEIYADEFS